MSDSIKYLLIDASKTDWLVCVKLNLERENHPVKDSKAKTKLVEFVHNETSFGYLIPIPKFKVELIVGAEVCPIYIIK